MDSSGDFNALRERVQNSLRSTVKTANRIASQDLSFQRTADPAVADDLDEKIEQILGQATDLLKSAAKMLNINGPKLEETEDIDLNWRSIIDVVDSLLEKSSMATDEYTGALKRRDAPTTPVQASVSRSRILDSVVTAQLTDKTPVKKWKGAGLDRGMRNANIAKPQLLFNRKADNHSTGPWRPILTRKPHAVVPLEESLGTPDSTSAAEYDNIISLPVLVTALTLDTIKGKKEDNLVNKMLENVADETLAALTDGSFRHKHPYETEILRMKYPDIVYQHADPIIYQPVETTTATWVDTWEGVLEMLEELKKANEIAVDLEHHDYRTYLGLVSLMQISTRDKDWVVDTLKPWRHQLEILNEVFADPRIIKVRLGFPEVAEALLT
jgi:exosome complex exonuclease RRP6